MFALSLSLAAYEPVRAIAPWTVATPSPPTVAPGLQAAKLPDSKPSLKIVGPVDPLARAEGSAQTETAATSSAVATWAASFRCVSAPC